MAWERKPVRERKGGRVFRCSSESWLPLPIDFFRHSLGRGWPVRGIVHRSRAQGPQYPGHWLNGEVSWLKRWCERGLEFR
jgi:hypothetical protein